MRQPKLDWRGFPKGEGYFDGLSEETQHIIRRMAELAFKEFISVDVYAERTEEIECKSRDGFIPFGHNHGGIDVSGYTDLMGIWGSGYYPSDKDAHAKIESIIEKSLDYAREAFFDKYETELKSIGINAASEVSYHDLYDKGHSNLAEEFSEYENEHLSGDYASVLYQIRIMYHGQDEQGNHSLTVFTYISATDAPYHRSSDVLSESLISWKTDKQLSKRLGKALKDTCSKTF